MHILKYLSILVLFCVIGCKKHKSNSTSSESPASINTTTTETTTTETTTTETTTTETTTTETTTTETNTVRTIAFRTTSLSSQARSLLPTVEVAVLLGGTVDTNFTGNITLSLNGTGNFQKQSHKTSENPPVLTGITTVAAVAGVAVFSEISITKPGSGYTLSATLESSDETATSESFTVNYPKSSFISTWIVPSNGDTVELPLDGNGTYNFHVDWGDNNSQIITTTSASHSYTNSGTYTVTITGTIQGWSFFGGGSYDKIKEVKQWGPLNFGDTNGGFYETTNINITATDAPDLSSTTNLSYFFSDSSVTQIPNISIWDVSKVTNLTGMFYNTAFNQPIESWDVSHVTQMKFMFKYSSFNQPLGKWSVSNVTRMDSMFENASAFNQPLGSWNISNVLNMENMFSGSNLSNSNYDNLLNGWSKLSVIRSNVLFHAGTAKYTAVSERGILTNAPNSWSITDGGPST